MRSEEFDEYRSEAQERFARQGVESGAWSFEQGLRISESLFASLLPQGSLSAGQDLWVFRRADSQEPVGRAWVGEVQRYRDAERIVLDFVLLARHRRTGIGARLLSALLDEYRQRGCKAIRCNVFGSNAEASRLALHVGFRLSHAEYVCEL